MSSPASASPVPPEDDAWSVFHDRWIPCQANCSHWFCAALANVISEGVSVGADIGNLSLLNRYEKDRKAANVAMAAVLDSFQKMYSVNFEPLNVLRAAAFHGAQFISPLKKNIISYALGDRKSSLFS